MAKQLRRSASGRPYDFVNATLIAIFLSGDEPSNLFYDKMVAMLYFDCRPGLLWPVLLWSDARFSNPEATLLGTAQESVGAAGRGANAGASAADESLGE